MSTSDGYVVGLHKVVDHGPNSQRYNIVIMGDGYQASEQAKCATDVQTWRVPNRIQVQVSTLRKLLGFEPC